jgi:hypothetical protein
VKTTEPQITFAHKSGMKYNAMAEDKQTEKKKPGWFAWFGAQFCCCGCFVLLLGLGGPAPLIPFFFPALFISSEENLPTAEHLSPEATNLSFY